MRVLVVDDHSLFRDGLVSLLNAAGFEVIGEVGDGETAIAETLRLKPDLVLMDVSMPKMNGLEALQQIKQQSPEITVVMLTASDEDQVLMEAIRLGANGFLQKNLNSNEFLTSLHGLEKGEAAMTLKTATRLMAGFSITQKTPSGREAELELSPKEIEMLPFICDGYTNKEISTRLNISENTVKYHIKNILQKLNLNSRAEIAVYAVQNGLYGKK